MRTRLVCCIFNLAPHYNEPIYKKMDTQLNCDFYIGDSLPYIINRMDYSKLSGLQKTLKNIYFFKSFYWQQGAFETILKPYKYYICTGDPHCISTWLILLFTKFSRKKTYLWTHGWYGNETILKSFLKKVFFYLADGLLLYGEYAKELMIKQGFKVQKLNVIYNSLDYDSQLKLQQKLTNSDVYSSHFNDNSPVLLYIGRIQKIKKIEYIIEVLNLLKLKGVRYNLMIIGEEVENTPIKSLILKYQLENQVWLYGACYDEETLSSFIFNSDLCISPGNVGLTAMHSMVYGTPVITHNNFSKQMPEFEVIKPGETGDFFKEDSVEDLMLKVQDWFEKNLTRREDIRKNCYQAIAEKYNPDAQIHLLKKILK